ncbi:G-patch domain and KOW motifs-containing protein-like isoform X1 [Silurus meridionalis]|uniref:G-patch domain and KOW motifs-containing protein-like isoform X1 n=1 Tax=Silurus meridionalis TaxID=175797 RepID=UPI001EEC6CB6|nr:G-patch domain and KOW motifs-containing protein-like isoform X1 [Silurus meridionalis]
MEPLKKSDGETKTGPISFGFSEKINKVKAEKSEERYFLNGVEGKELKSTKPVEKPKELIIPLIQKNRWYRHEGSLRSSRNNGKMARSATRTWPSRYSCRTRFRRASRTDITSKWTSGPNHPQKLIMSRFQSRHMDSPC